MIRNSIWQRNLLWPNVKATPIHVHTYPIHQNRYDSSTVFDESTHRKSNPALTYRRSRGVSKVWKWVAWKEKMITWTFRVLKVWNGWKSIVRISLILQWTFFLPKFSKCLESRLPVWRIDLNWEESFDSTTSSTPIGSYLRNIFLVSCKSTSGMSDWL